MKKEEGFPGQISYVLPEKIVTLTKENPLISDLYLTDIGYYPEARHHFRERTSGCAQSILIYCVEGKGEIRLKDSVHEVIADHFFLIPAGMSHAYHSDTKQPWSIYWIHFAGSKASLFNRFACRVISIDRSLSSRISERIGLFNDLFRNLDRGFSIETLEYVNQCLSFLLASFTHINQFREIRIADEKDPVTRSINFMIENLDQKLKLDDIAAETGLSVSHYSNIFLARTGHSPIDYFIQLKVQQGCRLLDNSGLLVAEISRKSGFEDQFYFSRVFKKVMGMSPAEYRKRKT